MSGYRSKSVATWIAVVGGAFGGQRLYLHGGRDPLAWLHPWPTALGLYGVWRMRTFGQDDTLATLLVPLLGVMLTIGMLSAIVIGLTPDERWDARYNPGRASHGTRRSAVSRRRSPRSSRAPKRPGFSSVTEAARSGTRRRRGAGCSPAPMPGKSWTRSPKRGAARRT